MRKNLLDLPIQQERLGPKLTCNTISLEQQLIFRIIEHLKV